MKNNQNEVHNLDEGREKTFVINMGPEIQHKFAVEREINLTYANQGKPNFVDYVDTNDLREFAAAARTELTNDKIREQLEYRRNPHIRSQLEEILETERMEPTRMKQKYLYHAGCSIYTSSNGQTNNKLETMKETGAYGGENRVSYMGTDMNMALIHGLGNYNNETNNGRENPQARILLLTIDTEKLQTMRNTYIDPESLLPAFEDEYGKSFIVHGGIPVGAIKKAEVIKYQGFKE